MITLDQLAAQLARIESQLAKDPRSQAEAVAHGEGLLSYEDLQDRLTVGLTNPRRPCLRTVKALVAKHRAIVRPVELGHKLIGFREASVARLLAALAGDPQAGARRL